MAKLTVYLGKNIVCSYLLEVEKTVHIGRDDANDIVIDNPAFAPYHAVFVNRDDECLARQLNNDFPLILNGKKTETGNLHHGDTITVGQYDIAYSTNQSADNRGQDAKTVRQTTPGNRKMSARHVPHTANFQVISGTNIGKISHLNTPMTLLGERGTGIVIISRRKDGYFASILENADTITINKQPLDDKAVKLHHNDVLVVGNMAVQFYLQ